MAVCCKDGFYGPDCKPCQIKGEEDGAICSGNGKCKGSGTRKGNGKCACDAGYTSDNCTECSPGYFNSYAGRLQKINLCTLVCPKNCKMIFFR